MFSLDKRRLVRMSSGTHTDEGSSIGSWHRGELVVRLLVLAAGAAGTGGDVTERRVGHGRAAAAGERPGRSRRF